MSEDTGQSGKTVSSQSDDDDDDEVRRNENLQQELERGHARSVLVGTSEGLQKDNPSRRPGHSGSGDTSHHQSNGVDRVAHRSHQMAKQDNEDARASGGGGASQNIHGRSDSKATRGIQPGGPLPGAYSVCRRARGEVPAWGLQDNSGNDRTVNALTADIIGESVTLHDTYQRNEEAFEQSELEHSTVDRKIHPHRKYMLLLLCVLVIAGIAIGVGMAVRARAAPAPAVASNPCDFTKNVQPDLQTLCSCYGNITVLPNDTLAQYNILRDVLGLSAQPADLGTCKPENFALFLLGTHNTTSSNETLLNRYVLNLMYLSMGGPSWKNKDGWLMASDTCVCCIYGVTCVRESVVSISMPKNNIAGSIPSQLGILTDLTDLNLSNNKISGGIPTDLGQLTDLVDLQLNDNTIADSIPSELGLLIKLQTLDLSTNELIGSLPSEIWNLTDLRSFSMITNKLEGLIPAELGKLTKLEMFAVASNKLYFDGIFPSWNMSTLTNLDVSKTGITGIIPASKLSLMTGLVTLNLDDNAINGTIPTEMGLLGDLKFLFLSTNKLTGTIPTELLMTGLVTLNLEINAINGTIPTEIGVLANLKFLFLSENTLTGTIPTELAACTDLLEIRIGGNEISGVVPPVENSTTGLCSLRVKGQLTIFEADCIVKVSCLSPDCCTVCTDTPIRRLS